MSILIIIGYIVALGAGGAAGFYIYKKTLTEKAIQFKEKMAKAKDIEAEMLEETKKKVEVLMGEGKKKVDYVLQQAEEKAQKIEAQRVEKMEVIQNRLLAREEKMDEKLEKLEEEKNKLNDKQRELEERIKEQVGKIAEVAGLSKDDAKKLLLAKVETENQKEIVEFIEKLKTIKKEEADKEATQIICRALPRVAVNVVTEFTSKIIDLPNEEFKGKLIGREGRNISFFEKISGVELIVDDTPLTVRISSFDNEKRYLAAITLQKLVKDGRINPFYIEKIYNESISELENMVLEKGKEALTMLNLPMMKPELVKLIGLFYLRSSYGQNLWEHSIEVAKLSEAIATEIGLDPILAKKAGLLHDIGKVIAMTGESHTKIGGEVLRKHGADPVIINAAESHHYDIPMTHAISRVIAAADAVSASRPGARFDTKELFIEKMGELEKLIYTLEGVEKVHIMQAGREIIVYVDPKKITDIEVEKLLKDIGTKIEAQLDYPGIIRVTGIRETKVIEFLR